MLKATDEIDAQFQEMPMTLAEAFTMEKTQFKKTCRIAFLDGVNS